MPRIRGEISRGRLKFHLADLEVDGCYLVASECSATSPALRWVLVIAKHDSVDRTRLWTPIGKLSSSKLSVHQPAIPITGSNNNLLILIMAKRRL